MGTKYRYSRQVAKAFAVVSEGDYHVDSDGHWLTLKPGWTYMGGQIVHDWTATKMLAARRFIEWEKD